MSDPKVRIRLENMNAGWVDIRIEVDGRAFLLEGVSYLSDSLLVFLTSGLGVLRGHPDVCVRFVREPGEWRLSVRRDDPNSQQVNLFIHSLPYFPQVDPNVLGPPEFEAACSSAAYARAVRNAFAVWKNETGAYKSKWTFSFPKDEFDRLDGALE